MRLSNSDYRSKKEIFLSSAITAIVSSSSSLCFSPEVVESMKKSSQKLSPRQVVVDICICIEIADTVGSNHCLRHPPPINAHFPSWDVLVSKCPSNPSASNIPLQKLTLNIFPTCPLKSWVSVLSSGNLRQLWPYWLGMTLSLMLGLAVAKASASHFPSFSTKLILALRWVCETGPSGCWELELEYLHSRRCVIICEELKRAWNQVNKQWFTIY